MEEGRRKGKELGEASAAWQLAASTGPTRGPHLSTLSLSSRLALEPLSSPAQRASTSDLCDVSEWVTFDWSGRQGGGRGRSTNAACNHAAADLAKKVQGDEGRVSDSRSRRHSA